MDSKRIRQKVKDDYNQIAGDFSSTRKHTWKDFQLFTPYLHPKMRVLDLGCGNGRLLLYLEKFQDLDYLGVDQSEALLQKARQQFPHQKFKCMDMATLKEGQGNLDALFAIASFHHLPKKDQLKTLKRWKTHLKSEGYLFMTNWNLHQKKYRPALIKSLFGPFSWRGCRISWKNKVQRYYYAFTLKRLQKLLKKAGFKVIQNDYVSGGELSKLWKAKNILTIAQK